MENSINHPIDSQDNGNKGYNFFGGKKYIVISVLIVAVIGIAVFGFYKFKKDNNAAIKSGVSEVANNDLLPDFDTPEKTIEKLERELLENGNTELYSKRTHISETLKQSLMKDLGATVEYFNGIWEHTLVHSYPNIFDKKIKTFIFDERRNIDDQHVFLAYTIQYENAAPKKDATYFIKKEDGWYIDFEPEYLGLKDDIEEWEEFKNIYNHSMRCDGVVIDGLNRELQGEFVIDIIKNFELNVMRCMDYRFLPDRICKKKIDAMGMAIGENRSCAALSSSCYNNLFTEKSKRILATDEKFFSYVDFIFGSIGEYEYTNMLAEAKKNDLFRIIGDNIIRFFPYPYDLVFENGAWKVDVEILAKLFNYRENIEKIEHLEKKDMLIGEYHLIEIVDALDAYKADHGYFPLMITDLFPEYYVGDASSPIDLLSSVIYAYYPDHNPVKAHIGIYDYEYNKKDASLIQYDSDFDSKNLYVNGFDGITSTVTRRVRINGAFVDQKLGLFDLTSDNFGKFRGYFEDLLK